MFRRPFLLTATMAVFLIGSASATPASAKQGLERLSNTGAGANATRPYSSLGHGRAYAIRPYANLGRGAQARNKAASAKQGLSQSSIATSAVSAPLLDTITIDEQNVNPVLGSYTLKANVQYTLDVSGTSVFSNGEDLDAFYCLGGGGSSGCPARGASAAIVQIAGSQYFYPLDAYQNQYTSPEYNCGEYECPDGLAYQSSHNYTMNFYPNATGVLKVEDYAAALGYTKNSPESGTYTIKIYGVPAGVTLPTDIRSPDSPVGMKDRIPPRVDTMIPVTVTGATSDFPVTLESAGAGPKITFDGKPTYEITGEGTYYPMLSANAMTPCGTGPDVRIEAIQNNQVLTKTPPFAVSAIPYNYTEKFHSEVAGQARGIVVQDGWRSDSEQISDLNCVKMAEVVELVQGDGASSTSSYLMGDSFSTDTHSIGIDSIYPNMERIADQATAFIDQRSGSQDIPMQNSGYEIVKSADATGQKFTTCKTAMAVTVTEVKPDGHKLTVASKAGATTPTKGICRTQDVPKAEPSFVSAPDTTCHVDKSCEFQIVMDGRPQPKLTIAGKRPTGIRFTYESNDTATITGTPAKGSQGRYHLTFTAKNGVGNGAFQQFTLYVDQ